MSSVMSPKLNYCPSSWCCRPSTMFSVSWSASTSSLTVSLVWRNCAVVFPPRTTPCRPCRCWRGSTWRVSAAWRGRASSPSAPASRRRRPSKCVSLCMLCRWHRERINPPTAPLPPPAVVMGTADWIAMPLFAKRWRRLTQLLPPVPVLAKRSKNVSRQENAQMLTQCVVSPWQRRSSDSASTASLHVCLYSKLICRGLASFHHTVSISKALPLHQRDCSIHSYKHSFNIN